jgi:hypothetical protein
MQELYRSRLLPLLVGLFVNWSDRDDLSSKIAVSRASGL